MGVNLVVKPIATYTGVSDTNGGGFVGGYDTTYANFCTATGGPTSVYQFSEVSETSGVYSFTITGSTGSNYIAGQLCYIEHSQYGYWYGRVVATYPADVPRVVYVPVNAGTGYLSEASIATLITNNIDAGKITVGGALATVEAGANLAKADGYTLMIQGPATYVRTAGVTDIVNLVVMGVDSSGVKAIGDDRPEEDLANNSIVSAYKFATGGGGKLSIRDIMANIYDVSGTATGYIRLPDTNYNKIDVENISASSQSRNNSWLVVSDDENCGYEGTIADSYINLYGFSYGANYKNVGVVNACHIDTNLLYKGRYGGAPYYNIANSIIIFSGMPQDIRIGSDNSQNFVNCTIISNNPANYLVDSNTTAKKRFCSCILVNWAKLLDSTTADTVGMIVNSATYNSDYGDALSEAYQNNIVLSANPFVGSGDYRLNPDGPDFAKLYDATTGRVLIGATGPEMTTGTGGGGVSASRTVGGV